MHKKVCRTHKLVKPQEPPPDATAATALQRATSLGPRELAGYGGFRV